MKPQNATKIQELIAAVPNAVAAAGNSHFGSFNLFLCGGKLSGVRGNSGTA